jgi:hypothetical protein
LLHLAIGVGHLDRLAGHAFERMKDDEPRAVGHEVGERAAVSLEAQGAVGAPGDGGAVAQLLARVLAGRLVAHREVVRALTDLEVLDDRAVGRPVPIAHEERYGTQNLDAAVADVAKIAVLELHRQRPRAQGLWPRDCLLGAEQHDRARRGGGHDSSP